MNIEEIKNEINQITKKYSQGKILDLCTGNGEFIHFIIDELINFSEKIGIDNHNRSIKEIFFEYKKMDVNKLEFPQNYFDIVTISNSLHHIENIELLFLNIKKVLKEDGTLIINEMFSDNQSSSQQTHVMLHHFSAEINKMDNIYHRETYKKNEIIDIVFKNNFQVQNQFEYNISSRVILNPIINKLLENISAEKKDYFVKKSEAIIENYLLHGFDNATELLLFCKK